ncbi:hypothetical protein LZK73_18325 [Neorhizobium galegae]|nr:hypothetical protein LZK73_18325 [Neorhizobium galegae]
MIIDHENNENARFQPWVRMKNSEAIRNPKWLAFHAVFIGMMQAASIHYDWNVGGLALFFMAGLGSLYLAGTIISIRGALARSRTSK